MKRQEKKVSGWLLILFAVLFVPVLLAAPAAAQTVTVVAPNGGEDWTAGSSYTIHWTTVGDIGTDVDIRLLKAGLLDQTIQASAPNTGAFTWTIPATLASGADYTVEIASVSVPAAVDQSDASFIVSPPVPSIITSPKGGETWLTGESRVITWHKDAVDGSTVELHLVRGQSDPAGGGKTLITLNHPNNGSFLWTIPASVEPDTNYRVMIVGATVEAYSANYFSIVGSSLQVTSPNGGENWVAGTPHAITWVSAGGAGPTVDIDLYKGGVLDTNLATAVPNSGSFTWGIPVGQTLGSNYAIRITSSTVPTLFDESDATFSVGSSAGVVTAPVGGEVWLGGETHAITWQVGAVAGNTVNIYLVKGQSDPIPGAETTVILNSPNNGSFPWVIPSSIRSDTDYRIKLVGGATTAYSDNYFSILQADLRVVSPNGGEKWLAGSTHPITWTTSGAAGDVRIDLVRNGVVNSVIAASTPDDGVFDWTIRNAQNPGADYTIRITSLGNAQVAGESAESFAVLVEQPCDILLSDHTAPIYAPIDTAVGTFSTWDRNPGDTFTYYFNCAVGNDNQSFRIVGNTLRTAEVFMTVGAVKNISVVSVDPSGLSVTRDFKIYVVGPDQAPTDISLNDSVITTGLASGARVGEFSTVDPNAADPNYGETFLYSLVNPIAYPDNDEFRIVGNQLQTDTIFLNAATVTKTIRVRTTDRAGLYREEVFTITVSVNQPPVLNPIGNKAVNEGQNLSFTLTATDPNGDSLVYSATGLPPGATLTGANFSWTPNSSQGGGPAYSVTFEVTDGVAVDTETIQITVSNVDPQLFFEQFTDGTSAGDTNWNKNAGTWTVPLTSAMRYKATSASVTSLSTVKTAFLAKISSGRIEGLVRMVNLAPTQNAMLIFAFQGTGKYRYVQLVAGGEVRIGQVGSFGNVTTGIKARNAVSAAVGTNYALRADTYADGRVKVYFKGGATPVLNYKFPTAVLGTVGVGVVNNGAEFDNFRVSDATVLPAARAR